MQPCPQPLFVQATHLIAFTETGRSARLIARWRCGIRLLAFTPNPRVRSQLALVWGVETFLVPQVRHTDDMVCTGRQGAAGYRPSQ